MKANSFELNVVGGSTEDAIAGIVTLPHQTAFRVELTNRLPGKRRCNVHLSFNGQDAGEYRVHGGQTVVLRRPANQDTPFLFLQVGTAEAKAAGLPLDGTAGVLTARFLPEAAQRPSLLVDAEVDATIADLIASEEGTSLGGTVYSLRADGTFQEADDIFTFQTSEATTFTLQLQGAPDPALVIDERDVLQLQVARQQAKIGVLEQCIEAAQADFDYDLALSLSKELRAEERTLTRLEGQAEVIELRHQLHTLQAAR